MPPSENSAAPYVGVVIVTYNGEPWIRDCLNSLRAQRRELHVIVVDNGSSDDTCGIIATEYPWVQLIRSKENVGFGRGNNIGIRAALALNARYVLLLNQDAYALPGSIGQLTEFMDEHPEFSVASPLQCSPDANHVDGKTLRGYLNPYAQSYLADACLGRVAHYYVVHGLNAAAWFIRTEVFNTVGGFDPLFFMYGEDDDMLMRWKHHGVKFVLLPACRIVHLRQSVVAKRPTVWQDIARRAARRRSELLVAIKRPGFSLHHMLLVGFAEGWLLPLADLLIRRQWRDYVAACFAASRLLFEIRRIHYHGILTAKSGAHFL